VCHIAEPHLISSASLWNSRYYDPLAGQFTSADSMLGRRAHDGQLRSTRRGADGVAPVHAGVREVSAVDTWTRSSWHRRYEDGRSVDIAVAGSSRCRCRSQWGCDGGAGNCVTTVAWTTGPRNHSSRRA
jgi:hypothetical protein